MKTRHLLIALGSVMRRQLLVTFLAGLLPVAAVAAGETVPCPQQKPGLWYRYAKTDMYNNKTEVLLKIDSVEGDRLILNGGTYITDRMYNWHRLGKSVATPKYYERTECPFSLGETRVYNDVIFAGAEPAPSTMTVMVDPEFVSLTVKAGSFKVVRIVSNRDWTTGASSGSFSGRVRHVSYYAPEIGIVVKNEAASTFRGEPWRDVYELLEYSLGD